jgi:hypothetical protein
MTDPRLEPPNLTTSTGHIIVCGLDGIGVLEHPPPRGTQFEAGDLAYVVGKPVRDHAEMGSSPRSKPPVSA